jgi:hypothetical protein
MCLARQVADPLETAGQLDSKALWHRYPEGLRQPFADSEEQAVRSLHKQSSAFS